MRVGIVGAGLQARRRAPVIRESPDLELVVISALHIESARPLAERMGSEAAEGWEAVVNRSDLDVVLVCTPPDLHAVISIAALSQGMHVLCEKPLARTVVEAHMMLDAARRNRRILKCGLNHRHHPGVQQLRRWVEEGRLGRLLYSRSVYGIGGRPGYEHEWRADPNVVSGGQLMEQGIHLVDLARWFLGEFTSVTAIVDTLFWPIRPLEDNAFVLYRTASGTIASIHSSLTHWTNVFQFEIFGTDAWCAVEGLGGGYGTERAILSRRDSSAPFSHEAVEFRGEDQSWKAEWDEFVAAVRDQRTPLGDGMDGLIAMHCVLAAYRASRSGRVVDIPRAPS